MFYRFLVFLKLVWQRKHLILSMAKRELANQYAGSFLGFIWTFINPMVMIFVFWFVFSVGFKAKPMNEVPFVVWLTAGMAPWFVFSDIVTGSAHVITGNAHLIKKTVFPSQILPVVKLVSSLVTHSVFIFILLILLLFQQMEFSLWFVQFVYYLFCLAVLAQGIGWAVSALNVFIRDVGQIVAVIMQVGFWATPIFWDIKMMPENIQSLLKLNPVYYIIQGYRDSFISFVPFWHHGLYTLYFWTVTLLFFAFGAFIFKKLKGQFADVL